MCNHHDPAFEAENTANGGNGCPVCNADQHAAGLGEEVARPFGQHFFLEAQRQVRPVVEAGCGLGQCSACVGCEPPTFEFNSARSESADAAF